MTQNVQQELFVRNYVYRIGQVEKICRENFTVAKSEVNFMVNLIKMMTFTVRLL